MTVCLVIIAIVLAQAGVGQEGHVNEPWVAWFVLVFVCIYIAAYAWSCKRLAPSSLVVFLNTGGTSGCVTFGLHPGLLRSSLTSVRMLMHVHLSASLPI